MEKQENGVRKFSKKEKLEILDEAKVHGVKVTLAKYDVYPATYYYWKKQYLADGADGLDHSIAKANRSRIRELENELVHYKLMLAEEQLRSRLKDELLKKKYPELRK
jgi:putative transposase